MNRKGILLCGHGTRKERGARAFQEFAERFASQVTDYEVEYGFLELSEPDFETGVKRLLEKGVLEIIAIPVFLFTGVHMERDIPYALNGLQDKYKVKIQLANYIGTCNEMVEYGVQLISETLKNKDWKIDDTAFLGLGIGASKAEANADLAKMTRLIQEKQNYPFAVNAYTSNMTYPALPVVLDWLKVLPFKNIVMLPFVFFPGVYMDKANDTMEVFAKENPDKNIAIAPLLGDVNGLFEVLNTRLQEVLDGKVDLVATTVLTGVEPHNHHGHDHGHSHDHGHHHQ
ncbi:sirohydrochlorin chelatase [Labilibaculum antarcticum]|uniref:Cobalamin biosynthesis protein CbiX n=1 Tax=Labilibaculum antarcticum TaxID=1717717 RepID=A0A1Y1CN02_9BACT|nr:sirohydrochlorin chelatase [Labilibaculum antarcticum]BAX81798.1 cobalamin biosynthesis protein CbiX [Labilibaculum antarcticum]